MPSSLSVVELKRGSVDGVRILTLEKSNDIVMSYKSIFGFVLIMGGGLLL